MPFRKYSKAETVKFTTNFVNESKGLMKNYRRIQTEIELLEKDKTVLQDDLLKLREEFSEHIFRARRRNYNYIGLVEPIEYALNKERAIESRLLEFREALDRTANEVRRRGTPEFKDLICEMHSSKPLYKFLEEEELN